MSQYEASTAPMLAGTQANWLLLGTLSLQVYKFYVCFPKERWWLKALVYTLYILELAQTAVTSHFAYSLLVLNWGNPAIFVKLPWSSTATPIFTGITSATVQSFFAWRIWTLKGDRIWARGVSIFIVMLALMQSLAAFISDARFASTTQTSELNKLILGVKVWLIGSAACDVIITITMLYILTQYRMRAPWKRTDTLLRKLIYNTVETGAITSVVAIIDVTLFILYTQTNYHQTPAFMLGKLYTSVLLATLNARSEMVSSSGQGRSTGPGANYGVDAQSEIQWRRETGAEMTLENLELGRSKGQVHISTVKQITRDTDDSDPVKHNSMYDYELNKIYKDSGRL